MGIKMEDIEPGKVENAGSFFKSFTAPSNLKDNASMIDAFVSKHIEQDRKIVLVTVSLPVVNNF